MTTKHRVLGGDARDLSQIPDGNVDLIVTSPPYPMIQMWDKVFASMSKDAELALAREDGPTAFELMHRELDAVWAECFRVLKLGGLACINIGDATRTVGGEFQIYSNHSRILQAAISCGFSPLPDILWRKQTNAPNKFMGSGMLPAGAYVTYEHEYVLILRKGGKRTFRKTSDKKVRRRSAFFWEERNLWFSDLWTDLKGTSQELVDRDTRARSGAYPFELAYRLILMQSVYGDVVLDPFLGTGTTSSACVATGRNSIGVEIDEGLACTIEQRIRDGVRLGAARNRARLDTHRRFIDSRIAVGKKTKHTNAHYGFPVVTGQERDLVIDEPMSVRGAGDGAFVAEYRPILAGESSHADMQVSAASPSSGSLPLFDR